MTPTPQAIHFQKEVKRIEECEALQWKLMRAFLFKSASISRKDRTVSIVFDTPIRAEEFERQILHRAARK